MAWIPVVVTSQSENYNNRKKGIVIALIVLILLSIMILISQFGMFNFTANFCISFIFGSIIILFIVFIVVLALSVRSAERYNRRPYQYQYSDQKPQAINENGDEENQYRENKSDSQKVDSLTPSKVRVNYCSYCGRYLSQDAIYCPDCGKRVDSAD
jgi:flagellar basal body-associated protein FliL